MVELTQEQIELIGFAQLVSSVTRSLKNQADSILDHIWVNSPTMVISHQNLVRSTSDHNVLIANKAAKNINQGGQNIKKRVWKNLLPQ